MIHVSYALRDQSGTYAKYVGVSIQSLLDNTREKVTIHIIHDNTLSSENRKKLMMIVYQYNQEILFYNVEDLASDKLELIQQRLPQSKKFCDEIAAFYRTMIPEFFDLERVIYIDSDTIVNLDIAELWQIDLKNFPIAAVSEFDMGLSLEKAKTCFPPCRMNLVDPKDYINSGVLILNLESIRSILSGDKSLFYKCLDILLKYPQCQYPDQDALNILFARNICKLPSKFNKILDHLSDKSHIEREIYHFCGRGMKPHPDFKIESNRLWFSHFIKTPFFTLETFGNLWKSFESIFTGNRNQAIFQIDILRKVYQLSMTRDRIFLTSPQYVAMIQNSLGTNSRDVFYNSSNSKTLNILIEDARIYRKSKIYLMLVEDTIYLHLRQEFSNFGLKENEDFFNIKTFLTQLPDLISYKDWFSKNF